MLGLFAGRVEHGADSRAKCAAACSSSVDLPMPGSPPSSTSDPGTMPPPSTRSNSSIPAGDASVSTTLAVRSGSRPAPSATGSCIARAATARIADALLDERVPRAALGAAPIHFGDCAPHSCRRRRRGLRLLIQRQLTPSPWAVELRVPRIVHPMRHRRSPRGWCRWPPPSRARRSAARFAALASEDDHLVARLDHVEAGDVHGDHVHRDRADDRHARPRIRT